MPDAAGALITQLYETGLDGEPDLAGLATFSGKLARGATPLQLAQGIANSPEFLADHAGQSATALITSVYANALGRAGPVRPAELSGRATVLGHRAGAARHRRLAGGV